MKYFTFFLLIFIFNNHLFAQQWAPVSPYPSEFFYSKMHMDESGQGILVGSNGIITKSNDFGDTFRNINSGTTQRLNFIDKVAEGIYVAIGDAGTIIRSTDGGETWESVSIPYSENLNKVYFINDSEGYIIGNQGIVLHTVNLGLSWEVIDLGISVNLSGIKFIDEETGYIWSDEYSAFFLTTDGGETWEERITEYTQNIVGLNFSDPQNGRVFLFQGSYTGLVLETSDGGVTWNQVADNSPGFTALEFLDENTGFGYNVSHGLFRTRNGGNTWEEIGYRVHDLSIVGTDMLFTIGQSGILRSDNLGISWTSLSSKMIKTGLTRVRYGEGSEVFVVGKELSIYKSVDNGLTFEELSINLHTTLPLVDVMGLSNNRVIAIGAGSRIFTSNNGGATWDIVEYDMNNFVKMNRIHNTIRVLSSGGEILQSDDLGLTWVKKETGFSNTKDLYFISPSTGFINVGSGYQRTIDGGETWEKLSILIFNCSDCFYFVNENIGYVVGRNSFKTVDGGLNWDPISTNISILNIPKSIHFRNENIGYFVSDQGRIFKTENGGHNWEPQISYTKDDLTSVVFNEQGIGIAVGSKNGVVLRIEEGELSTSVKEELFTLSQLKIFPNPSSYEINLVSENISKNSVFQIFNINGILVSETKGDFSGSPINVRNLATGTYYLLHTNGEMREKGMFVKQ